MAELIAGMGVETILLVLIVAIPSIIAIITWCKKVWNQREIFKQENIEKGKQIEARAEAKEARLQEGESRMQQLESDVQDLKTIAERQSQLIELLIRSDELDIKSWIKTQHEKWVPRNCIDSQTLDLLEQRFAIYTQEGGNSWAARLVADLRSLPVVTIVPIADIHEET